MALEEDPPAGVPEWVVTFGDMMSLLLTFFIMLVSLSEIKQEEKFQALVESLRRQFGHDTSTASPVPGEAKPRNARLAKLATMGRAKRANTAKGGDKTKAPIGERPRVKMIRRGDQINRGGVVYFDHGRSELTEEQKLRLQLAVEDLIGKPQKVEVRGHTSRRPPPAGSPYADNWQLAYARANNVKNFLVDAGIRPERIRLNLAGQFEPSNQGVGALDTKDNDRVEVFMIDELADQVGADSAPATETLDGG